MVDVPERVADYSDVAHRGHIHSERCRDFRLKKFMLIFKKLEQEFDIDKWCIANP